MQNRKQHAILLVVVCVLLLTHAPIVAEEAASLSEQSMLLKGALSGSTSSRMSVSATTAPDWGISPLQDFASQYGEIMLSQGAISLSMLLASNLTLICANEPASLKHETHSVKSSNSDVYKNIKKVILPILTAALPKAERYGSETLLDEDISNGKLGGYKIGQPWDAPLSTYSFKRKNTNWHVMGFRIFGCESKVAGIAMYYKDSDEEDYLIYTWEQLKKKN